MQSKSLNKHPLIQFILSMGMSAHDFAIFGSVPMALHGLKEIANDIDVIARGTAWNKAKEFGSPRETPMLSGTYIKLLDGKVEIYHCWFPKDAWNVDELIDTAEVVDGVRYVKLEYVLKYKKARFAEKDRKDIEAIEKYLANKH